MDWFKRAASIVGGKKNSDPQEEPENPEVYRKAYSTPIRVQAAEVSIADGIYLLESQY